MSMLRQIIQRTRLPRSASRVYLSQSTQPPSSSQGCPPDKFPSFTDPYPLPLSSSSLATSASADLDSLPSPLPRHNESIERMRARLIYQSRKRGTLEADLILSTFAGEHLHEMGLDELREFDQLLNEPDWDIYYWAVGMREPPPRWNESPLLEKLQIHTANEGKVIRRMPDLSALLG